MRWSILLLLAACGGAPAPTAPTTPAPTTTPAPAPAPAPTAPTPAPTAAKARLVTGAGIRLRATPDASTAEVGRATIGSTVTELELSPTPVTIGGKTAPWVKVRTSAGVEGWVFGAFTEPTDSPTAGLIRLAEQRVAAEGQPFGDLAELVTTLEAAKAGATGEDGLRLRLLHLQALGAALAALGYEEVTDPGRKKFIEDRKSLVYYNEIGGQWAVLTQPVETLRDEARGTAVAEQAAWIHARWPTGGECEGDAFCVIGVWLGRDGAYLKEHPKGPHAKDAVTELQNALTWLADDPDALRFPDAKERKEFQARMAEVDSILAPLGDAAKAVRADLQRATEKIR